MPTPSHPIAPPPRLRSPKTIYLLPVLLLVGAAIATIPTLRRERRHLILLRNLVDQAAAPGEPVLIDNWLLYHLLRWRGSPALHEQLVLNADPVQLPPSLPRNQELVVVSTAGSALTTRLRSLGYTLTADAAQAPWIASGYAVHLPARGPVLVLFAAPPQPQPPSQPTHAGDR